MLSTIINKLTTVALLLLTSNQPLAPSPSNFSPTFTKSRKTTHKIDRKQEYIFGYLEVLENRSNPRGSTIQIPVYIFKSRSENPPKDPIIYTVGGPGNTTMPSAQYMDYYKYLDDRDFILIEQRGNYYAKPHLDCPEWAEAMYQSNLPSVSAQEVDSLLRSAALSCRDRLIRSGIDLDGYNTNEIAADINDLVEVLEIESYNLLTISYSTKIAQVLMRDYPSRIRSVVMDSPLPLAANYEEESVDNLMLAVEKLLADCESDANCTGAFPDLKQRFFKYLEQKTKDPLVVQVENPQNGKTETFYLKGADLIAVFTLASTAEVGDVPFEINKLLNNDLSSVKKQLTYLFQGPDGGAGKGMRLSVWCAEETPFNSTEMIAQTRVKYPQVKGIDPVEFDKEVCEIWGVKKVADRENQAVTSDIPVLLINGEYDSVTPMKWAQSMMPYLENSFHLVFRAWKHTPTTYWSDPCGMQVAHDFFNDPTVKPYPDCFAQINEPEFKTE
ncbi:MAG: alpha/beta fold hydrolase [Bacteroidota bacterium]